MKTAAIVLAAGSSSRFGSAKQQLKLSGETLVERCCRVAIEAGCSPIFLVLSDDSVKIADEKITHLVNPNSHEGMGTSLALAARYLKDSSVASAIILLADQPAIEVEHIHSLIDALQNPGITIALAEHGNTTGPPACFHQSHFKELTQLSGDQGGKKIVQNHSEAFSTINIPAAKWDIDTPETWNQFVEKMG